jgi:aspartate kinase
MTLSLIVQKYGGTSVADVQRMNNVANRVAAAYKNGNDIVVIVSAQGKTTDELIRKGKEINPDPSKREMDVLMATGEQISIALLSMAIEKLGCPVVSLTGEQAGILTNSTYGNARILHVDTEKILKELDKKNIVVVAGFQGVNKYGDITTLGRGGSDTSAVAIAAMIKADICEIYTDVDGVFTADPRIVGDSSKLKDISYDEMLELASLGANVLHNRSVELAKKYDVNMVVRSSFNDQEGTNVKEVDFVEKMLVRGVTKDDNIARIAVLGMEDKPGTAYKLFSLLATENISVDLIIQSIGSENTNDISFTVSKDDADRALKLVENNLQNLQSRGVERSDDISKVSIVGAGMVNNPGVAANMFEALYSENINIHMISTSEIKISVLIDTKDADQAIRSIHRKFF